jgi:phosphatidylglycerophosphatase A
LKIKRSWYGITATLAGLGGVGKMPGTLGTAVSFFILVMAGGVHPLILLAVIAVGGIASDRYAKERGVEDPRDVVIDEVVGYWTSMVFLETTMTNAVMAFFLFRVIDIVKPFPVGTMERLPGGIGIMADDICGGLIVNLILRLISWLLVADRLGLIGLLSRVGR